jgi:phytol kinase
MSAEYGISVAVGFISFLMLVVAQLRRYVDLDPELARKIVHMGSGLMAMALPWIFTSSGPVVVACLICAGFVAICRHTSLLPERTKQVLGGVRRRSGGEYFFPLSIAMLFALSRGDLALYLIPVAVLTFADTAAAIVGTRWGVSEYFALAGRKSVEGSMAFFLVTVVVTASLLGILTDLAPVQLILVTGWLSLATTLAESISTRGSDNLSVPLVAFLFLALSFGEHSYAPWIEALLILTPLVVLSWLQRRHDEATRVGRDSSLRPARVQRGGPISPARANATTLERRNAAERG